MKKQMVHEKDWKKPQEKIILSHTDAMHLLSEVRPHVEGCVVGEYPKIERLAKLIGYNLKMVS